MLKGFGPWREFWFRFFHRVFLQFRGAGFLSVQLRSIARTAGVRAGDPVATGAEVELRRVGGVEVGTKCVDRGCYLLNFFRGGGSE